MTYFTCDSPRTRGPVTEPGPGDVLVSRTVVDLVTGSGIEFDERGSEELKAFPGRWELWSLRA